MGIHWKPGGPRQAEGTLDSERHVILDRSHVPWAIGASAAVLTLGVFRTSRHGLTPMGYAPGSPEGIFLGVVAAVLMIVGVLLSVRRLVPSWRLGSAEIWLKAHIWLSLAACPVVLLHTGFALGGGPLTRVLMGLLALVTVSGLIGLVFQRLLPQAMTMSCPLETIYEQIEAILADMKEKARVSLEQRVGPLELVQVAFATATYVATPAPSSTQGSGQSVAALPLVDFYVNQVRPFLEGQPSILRREDNWSASFDKVRTVIPPEFHPCVDSLQALCEERRQLLLQTRLHAWLHGWLFVHVPLSVILVILAWIHGLVSIRY